MQISSFSIEIAVLIAYFFTIIEPIDAICLMAKRSWKLPDCWESSLFFSTRNILGKRRLSASWPSLDIYHGKRPTVRAYALPRTSTTWWVANVLDKEAVPGKCVVKSKRCCVTFEINVKPMILWVFVVERRAKEALTTFSMLYTEKFKSFYLLRVNKFEWLSVYMVQQARSHQKMRYFNSVNLHLYLHISFRFVHYTH